MLSLRAQNREHRLTFPKMMTTSRMQYAYAANQGANFVVLVRWNRLRRYVMTPLLHFTFTDIYKGSTEFILLMLEAIWNILLNLEGFSVSTSES